MDDFLKAETEQLAQSWEDYDAPFLRDYLVAGVEDPRVNVQSILSRHFIIAALSGPKFADLMEHELRFAAVANWLRALCRKSGGGDFIEALAQALKRGADNVEGVDIPCFVSRISTSLPAVASGVSIPNYTGALLADAQSGFQGRSDSLNTFVRLWSGALHSESPRPLSVLEPACGSANDYRFLEACGIARLIDYTGFDLCQTNVANARSLFQTVRFEVGNIFELAAANEAFDLSFVHDLFEHLSPSGIGASVKELCRVTRRGLCIGFFQMDETPEHIVRPVDDYHVNTLSMDRMRSLLEDEGFAVQQLHIDTYVRECIGAIETHNPNAYTFLAWRHKRLGPQ